VLRRCPLTDLAIDAADYASQVTSLLWPNSGDDPGAQPLLALPSANRPRLLVPAHNRAVAAGAIRRYNVSRGARARATTTLLATGLRTGGLQLAAGGRLRMPGLAATSAGITATMRELVSPHCEVAVYIGIPRRNRKPVLLVFEPDGTLAAVGKLAASPLASRLVRNESSALTRIAAAGLVSVTVPAVLFAGEWSGHDLLVQSALPPLRREPKDARRQRDEGAVEIAGACGLRHVRLKLSGVLEKLGERMGELPAGAERTLVDDALRTLRDHCGGLEIPVGSWHGDWTPWNHAATADGLLVWDWERFATGVPAGYDALHCAGQELAAQTGDPESALTSVRARLDPLLRPFGVVPFAQHAVFVLYMLEILVRYTEDCQTEVPAGRRWVRALASALASATDDLAAPHTGC
jgi:hypothetical protein